MTEKKSQRKTASRPNSDEANKYDIILLENQLCFALYAASHAITRTYNERLAAMGLTYTQYLVLTVLWEASTVTVSELGRRLQLDSGTLTPLLQRMEAKDLVRRERSTADERQVNVGLTDRSVSMRDEALEVRRFVASRLEMSEDEIKLLRRDIMAVIERLEKNEPSDTQAAE